MEQHIVGVFEAKTHFSQLIDRVERGEEFIITRHGKEIAEIKKRSTAQTQDAEKQDLVAQIKAFRKGVTLGGLSWRELRDEGRR